MTTATDMLAAYLQAEAAILAGKEFRWADGRHLRREDLAEIRAGRQAPQIHLGQARAG